MIEETQQKQCFLISAKSKKVNSALLMPQKKILIVFFCDPIYTQPWSLALYIPQMD